jgi:hypothetical protein
MPRPLTQPSALTQVGQILSRHLPIKSKAELKGAPDMYDAGEGLGRAQLLKEQGDG